ncbi:MAG: hypothetical protein HY811_09865 [Planctomycetes bacterium]|nr:hypothetical protein [Planctomycetota bacterium]
MPILFSCKCGKKIKTKDELAGKKVKCPQCAMAVEVPIPKRPTSDKLELLPLENEPPKQKETAPSPAKGDKKAPLPPPESSGTKRCPNPKCRAEIPQGDVICHACGTQVGFMKSGRAQRKFSFFQQPLVRFAITIIALAAIGISVYIQFFKEKPDDGKPKAASPDETLKAAILDTESPNLEPLAKALAGNPANALKILFEEYQKGDLAKKIRATKGMIILAYYGQFNNKTVYQNITEKYRDQHATLKTLLADLFYLIITEQPEYELIEDNTEIKQYSSYFKAGGGAKTFPEARSSLSRLSTDDDPMVSMKASAALVSLGECTKLEKVANFLENPDTQVRDKARKIISYFTNQAFTGKAVWDNWWSANKTLTPKEWKK